MEENGESPEIEANDASNIQDVVAVDDDYYLRPDTSLHYANDLVEPQFNYQYDALNIRGHSPEQKVISSLRILGYDRPPDFNDEYLRIGKTTAYKYLALFCERMINRFGPTYLRKPTDADVREILKQNQEREFPGMLDSLDFMHWVWTGRPTYWAGQYKGHYGKPTVILEANDSYDFWIWHAFFGLPGSQNDIDVLHKSPLFEDLKYGISPRETRRNKNWTNRQDEDLRLEVIHTRGLPAKNYAQMTSHIENRTLYNRLREDLKANVWPDFGRDGGRIE
ncbi:uncharacterized protein LOC113338007 [Papaver somniferum]|uniref:uncharacterized protein LOC113338007 n=1 Tax=Papaver somniferum TaxID=3469 RepID=UPI000E6FB011|nr:uncharacterized protein LOC113338007 [Papaver somniferum]